MKSSVMLVVDLLPPHFKHVQVCGRFAPFHISSIPCDVIDLSSITCILKQIIKPLLPLTLTFRIQTTAQRNQFAIAGLMMMLLHA